MRLPIDSELQPVSAEREIPCTIDVLLERREKAFQIAEGNIKSAQIRQKETYDRKHQPPTYSIGGKVLLENTAQKQRKGGKLESPWLGPYLINKDLGIVHIMHILYVFIVFLYRYGAV